MPFLGDMLVSWRILPPKPLRFSNDRPSWHISAGCRLASQTASHWRPKKKSRAVSIVPLIGGIGDI